MKEKFADRLLPVSVFGMGVRMDAVPFFTSLVPVSYCFQHTPSFSVNIVYTSSPRVGSSSAALARKHLARSGISAGQSPGVSLSELLETLAGY